MFLNAAINYFMLSYYKLIVYWNLKYCKIKVSPNNLCHGKSEIINAFNSDEIVKMYHILKIYIKYSTESTFI